MNTVRPSEFAKITADTLNRSACEQIIRFLRSSSNVSDAGLSQYEQDLMAVTANGLDVILNWQSGETEQSEKGHDA